MPLRKPWPASLATLFIVFFSSAAAHTLPNILIWHDVGIDRADTVRLHNHRKDIS